MIRIALDGVPVPKARPRFLKSGRAYSDPASAAYAKAVAWSAKAAMGHRKPLAGALSADIVFYMPWPKSLSDDDIAERIAMNETHVTTKPDLSNMVKNVEDALNGIVYRDDSQITDLTVRKRYCNNPGIVMQIKQIGEE